MMPPQKDIDLPLLRALVGAGGKAPARNVYKAVEEFFPQLTDADKSETLPSGGSRWTNRIQWVRQALVDRGELTTVRTWVLLYYFHIFKRSPAGIN